jgi:hypothetical protein
MIVKLAITFYTILTLILIGSIAVHKNNGYKILFILVVSPLVAVLLKAVYMLWFEWPYAQL